MLPAGGIECALLLGLCGMLRAHYGMHWPPTRGEASHHPVLAQSSCYGGGLNKWLAIAGPPSGLQGFDIRFKHRNAILERFYNFLEMLGGVSGCDELRTVPIVGENLDAEDPLGFGSMATLRFEFLDEVGMLTRVHNGGVTEHLQPRATGIVHEKERDAVTLGEAADADHLPVSSIVGKGDLSGAEDFEEAYRSTAVLEVGPIVLRDRGQVEAVPAFDHFDFLITESFPGGRIMGSGIAAPVVVVLRFEHRGGEDFVHVSISHGVGST